MGSYAHTGPQVQVQALVQARCVDVMNASSAEDAGHGP